MRIHLLCDQKWRDLPNLTAVKIALERCGHRVLLSTTKDAAAMIQVFRPHCVVLNNLFATRNQRLAVALMQSGVGVVILPTEGAARPELRPLIAGEFADFSGMDLHLAWSEASAEDLRRRWNRDAQAVPVIGCTRFDFYTSRFRSAITPRDEFCRQHDLDPDRPIVTWATVYNHAEEGNTPEVLARYMAEIEDNGLAACYRRLGLVPQRIPSMQAVERREATAAFMQLAAAMPQVQFVVRPHPAERRAFYLEYFSGRNAGNMRFCPQDYIWNVLNASDVHLHRQCTTAIEAWMWRKPTIEMAFATTPELAWPDREAGSDVASTTDELISHVERYLKGDRVDQERHKYRAAYVHSWFGPADGNRCDAAAKAIDAFLAARRVKVSLSLGREGVPARQSVTAMVRYAVGMRPTDSLRPGGARGKVRDVQDKQITRDDVRDYSRLIAPAFA
jgi:surface carbohydrate biosynthesis protein